MAEKRKDSRGYLLNSGEHQRSDGRYSFSYTDKEHNRRIIYAKSLVELRQKELKIIKEIDSGLRLFRLLKRLDKKCRIYMVSRK